MWVEDSLVQIQPFIFAVMTSDKIDGYSSGKQINCCTM